MAEPRLFEIRLPAGRVNGFDIAFQGWTGNHVKYDANLWLSQGYDGVRFIGEGRTSTHIYPAPGVGDSTILVGPHNGIVQFESLSLHCAPRKGIHMGLANPSGPVLPKFKAVFRDFELVADAPLPGSVNQNTTVWGLFGYQCDWDLLDCTLWMQYSAEHASYAHGYAKSGLKWENVTVMASGAEGCKNTARPSESRFVSGALIHIKNCSFKAWNQPWSWRGGAGFTAQGAGANILIENSHFRGGIDNAHGRCVMLDDSGLEFYGPNGTPGVGPANGHVIIRNSGMYGVGPDWYGNVFRVGTLNANRVDPWCARSLLIENCGIYGHHSLVAVYGAGQRPVKGPVIIQGCNTPAIRDYMAAHSYDVSVESLIMGPGPLIPVSQGISF